MSSSLKGLFGGGEAADHDFVQRVTTGNPSEGFTTAEAQKHLQKVLKKASPDQIKRATKQAVASLPDDQRAEFAQMLQDRQAGRGGVQIQRSGGSSGGGQAGGAAEMPGLEDVLGGLLGGAQSGGGGGTSGGGGILQVIMSMLGSLFGGGKSSGRSTSTSGATAGGAGDLFGSLGDLINTPAGKAVIGGIAAYATKEMMENKR